MPKLHPLVQVAFAVAPDVPGCVAFVHPLDIVVADDDLNSAWTNDILHGASRNDHFDGLKHSFSPPFFCHGHFYRFRNKNLSLLDCVGPGELHTGYNSSFAGLVELPNQIHAGAEGFGVPGCEVLVHVEGFAGLAVDPAIRLPPPVNQNKITSRTSILGDLPTPLVTLFELPHDFAELLEGLGDVKHVEAGVKRVLVEAESADLDLVRVARGAVPRVHRLCRFPDYAAPMF